MKSQIKDTFVVFTGNTLIKISNFFKQILLAYFLGVSGTVDVLLVAQIIPGIIQAMVGGSGGELLVNKIKNNPTDSFLIVYYLITLFLINTILSIVIIFCEPFISLLFDVRNTETTTFSFLNLIFALNLLPQLFVSLLRPYLYYKKKYKYFVYSTLTSETSALIIIILFAEKIGIKSFAIGTIIASTINALFYIYVLEINIMNTFKLKGLKLVFVSLVDLYKSLSNLAGQTLINHLSNFVERTVSVNFLVPGYLSSLNYSKSINELPNAIFTSSLLTTTYIEQNKKAKLEMKQFKAYSQKMLKFYILSGAFLQIGSIIFAPLMIILIYKRGKFDLEAVNQTLIIYQILQTGFVFGILNNFLTRTLYIYSLYRQLFYFVTIKTIIHIIMIITMVSKVSNIIPISIVVANIILFLLMLYKYCKIEDRINMFYYNVILLVAVVFSGLILIYINQELVEIILKFTTAELLFIYAPIVLILTFIGYYVLKMNGYSKYIKLSNFKI